MEGNFHVRFLGGWVGVIPPGYPAGRAKLCLRNRVLVSVTSDASNLPEHVATPPIEARAEPPSADPFAAGLRGFGLLGIVAILVILAGNLIVPPLSAVLVIVWVRSSRTQWREI